MHVLLINSPVRLDAKPNCIPYGLATVAAELRLNGFEVSLLDVNALRLTRDQVLARLRQTTWDLVGVSGLITTFAFQRWLVPHLKAMNPSAKIVSGGGLATTSSQLLFAQTPLDIAVIGEGERTMTALCRALARGGSLDAVDGIAFRHEGRVRPTRPRTNIADLDEIALPAWDLLPMEIYLGNTIWGNAAGNSSGFRPDVKISRSMNVVSSRGCPCNCRYCYHLFGRSSYRFRSPGHVLTEVEYLVEAFGADFIGFVDDNMMADRKWLRTFCDLLLAKKLPVVWGCHGRVTSAVPEILVHMAAAGCVWIGYGIESGSPQMLKAMGKRATVAQARDAIENTRRAGIFPNTTFIFGYPGETRRTIQETIDFKRRLGLDCGSFFATPYPGTPLYEQVCHKIADETAFIESLDDATRFSINLTGFDDDELFALKDAQDHNQDVL